MSQDLKRLYIACKNGDMETVRSMRNFRGVNGSYCDGSYEVSEEGYSTPTVKATPLFIACKMGHVKVVRELFKNEHLDVNMYSTLTIMDSWRGGGGVVGEGKECPIHVAVRYRVDVVRSLLGHKDLDLRIKSQGPQQGGVFGCWYTLLIFSACIPIVRMFVEQTDCIDLPEGWERGFIGHSDKKYRVIGQLFGEYQKKQKTKKNSVSTNPKSSEEEEGEVEEKSKTLVTLATSSSGYSDQARMLVDMGFMDVSNNQSLLKEYSGNIEKVIDHLTLKDSI